VPLGRGGDVIDHVVVAQVIEMTMAVQQDDLVHRAELGSDVENGLPL